MAKKDLLSVTKVFTWLKIIKKGLLQSYSSGRIQRNKMLKLGFLAIFLSQNLATLVFVSISSKKYEKSPHFVNIGLGNLDFRGKSFGLWIDYC